jgi:hypothetical protein
VLFLSRLNLTDALGRAPHQRDRQRQFVEYPAALAQQELSSSGQGNPARIPAKKTHAEVTFKIPNLPAQWRLRDMQRTRRFAERWRSSIAVLANETSSTHASTLPLGQ